MATPKGPSLARSGSTWIHWWSSVASAKRLTRSWVIGLPLGVAELLADELVEGVDAVDDGGHGALLAGQGLIPVRDATRVGAPHYADGGELRARARRHAAAPPPGHAGRRGPGRRLRGERRAGHQRLAGPGHGRGQPGWLDRAPGRGGRAGRGLLLHGGRRVPLHDGPARADGARARGGAPVAAAAAPRARRPSCGACTSGGGSTRRWPSDMVERGHAGPRPRPRDPRPRGARDLGRSTWARPWQAAAASFVTFALGAFIPLAAVAVHLGDGGHRAVGRARRRWPRSWSASCWPASPSGPVVVSALRQLAVTVGRGRRSPSGWARPSAPASAERAGRAGGVTVGRLAAVRAVDVVDGEAERAVERDGGLVGGVGVEHPDGDAAAGQRLQPGHRERPAPALRRGGGGRPRSRRSRRGRARGRGGSWSSTTR